MDDNLYVDMDTLQYWLIHHGLVCSQMDRIGITVAILFSTLELVDCVI